MLDLVNPSVLLHLAWGVASADEITDPNQDRAGWAEFLIWFGLGAAMLFLAFSFVKQLRKAQAAKDAGVYGDEPASEDAPADEGADQTGDQAGDQTGDQAARSEPGETQ